MRCSLRSPASAGTATATPPPAPCAGLASAAPRRRPPLGRPPAAPRPANTRIAVQSFSVLPRAPRSGQTVTARLAVRQASTRARGARVGELLGEARGSRAAAGWHRLRPLRRHVRVAPAARLGRKDLARNGRSDLRPVPRQPSLRAARPLAALEPGDQPAPERLYAARETVVPVRHPRPAGIGGFATGPNRVPRAWRAAASRSAGARARRGLRPRSRLGESRSAATTRARRSASAVGR